MTENIESKKQLPPYLPYKTLMNFLDGLKAAMPQRIDRSLMTSMSGAMQYQLMSTLEYLGLIAPDTGIPTEKLTKIVHATGNDRQQVIKEILISSYPFLFEDGLNLESATTRQLQERFQATGAAGNTLRKCVTFFLKAAKAADLKLSPHFKKTYGPRMNPTRIVRRKSSSVQEPQEVLSSSKDATSSSPEDLSIAKILSDKFPAFDPTWDEETRKSWFAGFNELMAQIKGKSEDK